jgi:hypothetical protein
MSNFMFSYISYGSIFLKSHENPVLRNITPLNDHFSASSNVITPTSTSLCFHIRLSVNSSSISSKRDGNWYINSYMS